MIRAVTVEQLEERDSIPEPLMGKKKWIKGCNVIAVSSLKGNEDGLIHSLLEI